MTALLSRWFNGENSLGGAAKLLAVTLFLSNVLGVVRDRFLAQKIPTADLDIYYAAFRIPDFVFNILILGAIASAFIPVFTDLVSHHRDREAYEVAAAVITAVMILMILILVGLFFAMPWLINWLVPYFEPAKQGSTVALSRWFLMSPFLFGLSYFLSGVLNSYRRFFVYSLAPILYNLSIIAATAGFADRFGFIAPAWGVVIGAAAHLLVQVPAAVRLGFRWRLRFDLHQKGVRKIGKLMTARIIGLIGQQFVWLGFTSIGSGLGAGAVAIYNLADNIQTMPTAVFGNSVSQAVFPHLSESAARLKRGDFARLIERAAVSILYFLVPSTFGIVMLRAQIVRLLLGSGHFGWEQTVDTANTLGFFGLTLIFSGLTPLFLRAFYAWHDTKTPSLVVFVCSLFSLGAGYILSRQLGVSGLALGFSFGVFAQALVLYSMLKKRLPEISEANILIPFFKMFAASLIMAGGLQLTKQTVGTIYDLDRYVEVFIQTAAAVAVSLGIYLGLMKIFGQPKLAKFFNFNGRSNF